MIIILLAVLIMSFLLAPMGCVLLWQRYNYFSDGLAHACLFSGILSHFLHLPQMLSMIAASIIFAIAVYTLKAFSNKNTVINLVSTFMVASAIILASRIPNASVLENMLFGDILSFTEFDLRALVILAIITVVLLAIFLKDIILISLSKDLAKVQKISVGKIEFFTLIWLSIVTAVTIKYIGVLLITALLVIPPAAARIIAKTPLSMVAYGVAFSLLSGILGMYVSFRLDWPLAGAVAIFAVAIYVTVWSLKYKGKT